MRWTHEGEAPGQPKASTRLAQPSLSQRACAPACLRAEHASNAQLARVGFKRAPLAWIHTRGAAARGIA